VHWQTGFDDSNNYLDILQKYTVFNVEETNENDLQFTCTGVVIERNWRKLKCEKIKKIHSIESEPLNDHGVYVHIQW